MRVLLAGESWVTHTTHIKGLDHFSQCGYGEGTKWLRRAVESAGHEFSHIPNHLAPVEFPTSAERLGEYDVVILSDIGTNTLLLHPETTMYSKVCTNRLEEIRRYVASGGGLVMIGGYLSFQGIEAKARYHSTAVEEALPVTLGCGDDRMEMPQGFTPVVVEGTRRHPILAGLPERFPVMLFYNQVKLKPNATLLLQWETDPILAVWEYGQGRSAAFTPDAAPHGATPEFLEWEYFDLFWQQVVGWLGGSE